jgi:hypothetical protein
MVIDSCACSTSSLAVAVVVNVNTPIDHTLHGRILSEYFALILAGWRCPVFRLTLAFVLVLSSASPALAKIHAFNNEEALLRVLQSQQLQALRDKESTKLAQAELEKATVTHAASKFSVGLSWRVSGGANAGVVCTSKATTTAETATNSGITTSHLTDPSFDELRCAKP